MDFIYCPQKQLFHVILIHKNYLRVFVCFFVYFEQLFPESEACRFP